MRQHVCVDLLSRFGMIVNTMNLKWINGYNGRVNVFIK